MTKDVCSSLALVGCSYSTAICQLKDKLAIQSVLKVNKQLFFSKINKFWLPWRCVVHSG